MEPTLLSQGKTSVRDALKTLITHVVVSDDNAVFNIAHTGINPTAAATSTHVEEAADTNIDGNTWESAITIDGATEFTDKIIYAIGVSKGLGVRQATGADGVHTGGGIVGTDAISRSVRTLGIGVEITDTYTLAVRGIVEDNS
jgi:hypothetical protein